MARTAQLSVVAAGRSTPPAHHVVQVEEGDLGGERGHVPALGISLLEPVSLTSSLLDDTVYLKWKSCRRQYNEHYRSGRPPILQSI